MDYAMVEKISSSEELDRQIAETQGLMGKLMARRETVLKEERARKQKAWTDLGEAVEEAAGCEVELAVFKGWLEGTAESLRRFAAGLPEDVEGEKGKDEDTVLLASDGPKEGPLKPAGPSKGELLAEAIKRAVDAAEKEEPGEPADDVGLADAKEVPKESPKEVTARIMREILPNVGLDRAHINELIQAADHGVDFETIRLLANPNLTLQQVRSARAAAEKQAVAA